MLRYYYINKGWMLSPTAQYVYRIAASLALVLFFLLVALRVTGGTPVPIRPIVRALVLVGIFGTALTSVAMEYFLFGFDESSAWKKTFWFVAMLFPLLGAPLYCFLVYSRSEAVKRGYPKRIEKPSM